MDFVLNFTAHAVHDLDRLDKKVAKRILDKLDFFIGTKNPLKFAKRLNDFRFGGYRFRVGDYRVIFDINRRGRAIVLIILSVRHRKTVYNLF